eukprot:tig00021326_g20288.t1
MTHSAVIVGSGVFGLSSALEFRRRGYDVTVLELAPRIPNLCGASCDHSRIVRYDYTTGEDLYVRFMQKAFGIWEEWNRKSGRPLFTKAGLLLLSSDPRFARDPGAAHPTFELDCFQEMRARGIPVVPLAGLSDFEKHRWFPLVNHAALPHGYLNPNSGWGHAKETVEFLAKEAEAAGVRLLAGRRVVSYCGAASEGGRASVACADGATFEADVVLLAAGAYTPTLLPELRGWLKATAHPVIYFDLAGRGDLERWRPPLLPVCTLDTQRTGYYCFPAQEVEGGRYFKLALHAGGLEVESPEELYAADIAAQAAAPPAFARAPPPSPGLRAREAALDAAEAKFREFLRGHLPEAAELPAAYRRMCHYADAPDGDFLIDGVPGARGVFVASGDSGHAFKFAPVLGQVVADIVEGVDEADGWGREAARRFRWRVVPDGPRRTEGSRMLTGEAGRPRA